MNARPKLVDLLRGVRYPIVQAPMAGSDNAEMVAAASNAGALGSLGAQYRTPGEIRDTIRQIRTLTDKPFAVNLFALPQIPVPRVAEIEEALIPLKPYYEKFGIPLPSPESVQRMIDPNAQLEVILEEGVPVFSYTLGLLDATWTKRFKQAGTVVIGTATNVREAVVVQEMGADAITVQGAEAGGHRGTFTNESGDISLTNLWCGQSGHLARQMSTEELVRTLVTETNAALDSVARWNAN